MNNVDYWAKRKAEFVVSQLDKAEQTAEVMKRTYAKAQKHLVDQADKIFLKYQRDYKLSETQARAILKRSGVDVMKLKRELQNGVQSDEIKQILADMDSAAYASRIDKLIQSQKEIDAFMVSMSQNDNRLLTNHLKSIAEDSYVHEMFLIQKRAKVAFEFSALDPKYVDKLLRVNWSGKHFSNAIWNNHAELGQTLKEEYLVNYLTGRSSFDMAKVIEERFGVEGYKARRLVRTESTFFSAELEAKAYEEAGIEKYEYVSVLDDRTTHICKSKDGKIYNVKDRRAGVNYPPLHVFCRATTIAHIPEKWFEKVDGDVFDDTLGYNEWKKSQKTLKKKSKKSYNKNSVNPIETIEKVVELPKLEYVVATPEIEKQLQKRSDEIFGNLLKSEIKSIKEYTGVYYGIDNRYLRNALYPEDEIEYAGTIERVKNITNVLSNNRVEHNLKVYRGVEYGEFLKWQKDGIIDTFKSTSIDYEVANKFNDSFKVIINVPKNSQGLYIGANSKIGAEKELLLNFGQKYRVNKIDWDNGFVEVTLNE